MASFVVRYFFLRNWNLIEVNVTRTELNEALKTRISHLVYPLNTVLDESIGAVLWFGSRGSGTTGDIDYSSNCRVGKRVVSSYFLENSGQNYHFFVISK